MNSTRVFFVTESDEDDEELHETLEEAEAYRDGHMADKDRAAIRVGLVNTAYKEGDRWNYEDVNGWIEFLDWRTTGIDERVN